MAASVVAIVCRANQRSRAVPSNRSASIVVQAVMIAASQMPTPTRLATIAASESR